MGFLILETNVTPIFLNNSRSGGNKQEVILGSYPFRKKENLCKSKRHFVRWFVDSAMQIVNYLRLIL